MLIMAYVGTVWYCYVPPRQTNHPDSVRTVLLVIILKVRNHATQWIVQLCVYIYIVDK